MVETEVRKVPGCRLTEVDGVVVKFIAGHRSHQLMEEVELSWIQSVLHIKSLSLDSDLLPFEVKNSIDGKGTWNLTER